ncbi:spore germination protein [Haloimpatiens sp. FM7315]|uniref:spore germination protein n=1 Tax=Haloimpatiens sp. FM7315 TaxID=3298609 RepID=UPI00370C274C
MLNSKMDSKVNYIKNQLGTSSLVVTKKFNIGNSCEHLKATLIYINALASKDMINRDILNPLMISIKKDIRGQSSLDKYICENCIPMCNTSIETDIEKIIEDIKLGKSALVIEDLDTFIVLDTTSGNYRAISDPANESSIRGSREGFIENLETNLSILRRKIGDKNLTIETFKIGRRSQSPLSIVYIKDLVDDSVLKELRTRLNAIDVDSVTDTGMVEQYIEDSPFSIFPQIFTTERPDIVKGNLMEGQIALLLSGSPHVMTVPSLFVSFLQGIEDYNQRTIVSTFVRLLRTIAIFLVITLPSLYLTLLQYNVELIPLKFIAPIIQSRKGIALPPFLEILSMEIIIEFLREGGLRLPPKIAQTLSIVGGIIIGNTAVESKVVSPTTLLIIGISVVSSFLIPNYEMSLSIRFLRFPMLFLANALGFLGIAIGWFYIIIHLSSLKSFTVQYFNLPAKDLKDIFVRAPLWEMNNRPDSMPMKDKKRQTNFMNIWRKKDE